MRLRQAARTGIGLLLVSGSTIMTLTQPAAASAEAQKLRVVKLEGAAYERGVEHGRTLRKEIHSLVKTWKGDMEVRYKMPADKFISKFLAETRFIEAVKKWTRELLDEVRGISESSGIDFDTIFAMQLPDELWAYGEEIQADHCTSAAVARNGIRPTVVAQTMDIPWMYQGYQTLLQIRDPKMGREAFVLTVPGMIGLNGMNDARLAVACNTLLQLQSSRDGLPVAFIVRGILGKKTFKEAVDFVHSIKHASGQNYIIGGPDDVRSLECSANKIAQFLPTKGARITYHTNHPLANDDYRAKYARILKTSAKSYRTNSHYRFESVEKRFGEPLRPIGLDLFKELLSSRDTENGPVSNDLTYAATIMILSVRPELHITRGRPDLNAFQVFRFSEDNGG